MYGIKLIVVLILFQSISCEEVDKLVQNYKCRHCRKCDPSCHRLPPHQHCGILRNIFRNPAVLIFFIFMMIFLLLMSLGIMKGLIGLFCSQRIGLIGLNMLIDLPRPLATYQEKELANRPVRYDIAGWPVHPDTEERTVRPISKQTEFCLNIVFFLSYPLALLIRSCAFCCCIRNSRSDDEDTCFKSVRIIRLIDCKNCKKKCKEKTYNRQCDVYANDKQEDDDTDYVIAMLKRSGESLHGDYCCCNMKRPKTQEDAVTSSQT